MELCSNVKARNDWGFNHSPVEPSQVIRQAVTLWCEIGPSAPQAVESSQARSQFIHNHSRWAPPSQGCLKANCDVSLSLGGRKVSLAVILSDWKGRLVDGVVSMVQSLIQGEARAVRLAYLFLRALGLSNVQVKSDKKSVIELSASELDPLCDCLVCIHDIRFLGLESSFTFSWAPRTANRVVDWLASTQLN
ncbi:unnamed protein product [Camellia sinensis]